MKRNTRQIWDHGTAQTAQRACDHSGCANHGEYRAPRSRTDLNSYYWFCLEHVRAYNASWDYYAGMSAEEIERSIRLDSTWQRPTWKLGAMSGGRERQRHAEHIRDPFGFFNEEGEARPRREAPPSPEEEAMKVMDLQGPLTLTSLKARYKELVKRHHPDANGGDKAAEERFKEIGQAYKTLMNSLNP